MGKMEVGESQLWSIRFGPKNMTISIFLLFDCFSQHYKLAQLGSCQFSEAATEKP